MSMPDKAIEAGRESLLEDQFDLNRRRYYHEYLRAHCNANKWEKIIHRSLDKRYGILLGMDVSSF